MESIYQHTFDSFVKSYHSLGEVSGLSHSALREIYRTCFHHGEQAQKKWPLRWRESLEKQYQFKLPIRTRVQASDDGSIKFLHQLEDASSVETVLIPFQRRYTVCLSTQVGCAVGCSFCFTATQGLKRHLKSSEIVGQYISSYLYLKEVLGVHVLTPSIVYMGQGEPLHNFDEVKCSIEVLTGPGALGLGPRQVTLSTSGFLPGLKRWSELPPINLALSLHSTFNNLRSELIPINSRWPLESIFSELDQVKLLNRQFITYEYLLITEVNDRPQDIEGLVRWLGGRPALINIIPFNPFPGSLYQRPSDEQAGAFKAALLEHGLRAMVRTTKGDEILAACGQLNSST